MNIQSFIDYNLLLSQSASLVKLIQSAQFRQLFGRQLYKYSSYSLQLCFCNHFNIIMDKRCLPKRSTRGQLPLFLRDPPPPEKKQKPVVLQDPLEAERRELQVRRKNQQFLNFKKYPFHRAVHYFFDLDTFPRSEGHISYAIDTDNALKNSFSNDKNRLNTCSYGEVLNRKLFGLPISEHFALAQRKQNKHKNICYSYLFQTEDKKYNLDRSITTLNVILRKIKKGITLEQLKSFSVLTNDKDLQGVFDQTMSQQERMEIINKKIQILKNRKESNKGTWLADDQTYFYHALNQKLHNQIAELKQKLVIENVIKRLRQGQSTSQEGVRKSFLKKDVFYYNSTVSAEVQFLSVSTKPMELFFFEDFKETIKLASFIVAKKSQSVGEVHFYEAKSIVKKIFNYDLALKPQKAQNFNVFQKNFRKKCEDIKKWKEKNLLNRNHSKYPSLECTNWRESMGPRMLITGKEYLMVLVFYWICRALFELKPLISQFPQIISYISSEYFPKVYNSLVQATQSAHIGMMCVALESLPDLFSKPDPLASIPVKLQIECSPVTGMALISKEDLQNERQEMSTVMRQEQKYEGSIKRFKYDSI